MPPCYLSISVFSGLSICLFGICYITGLRYRPVSNRLPLSWQPCNHVKWKRTGQTENNKCPTIALHHACPVKTFSRQGTSYSYGNTYKNQVCCQKTSLSFTFIAWGISLWALLHRVSLSRFCKWHYSK